MIRANIELEGGTLRLGVYDAEDDPLASAFTLIVFDERPRARHDVIALIRLSREQATALAEALR